MACAGDFLFLIFFSYFLVIFLSPKLSFKILNVPELYEWQVRMCNRFWLHCDAVRLSECIETDRN